MILGSTINALIYFVIVAAVVYFVVVVPVNKLMERRKRGEEPEVAAPTEDILLLQEIRDLLRDSAAIWPGPLERRPDDLSEPPTGAHQCGGFSLISRSSSSSASSGLLAPAAVGVVGGLLGQDLVARRRPSPCRSLTRPRLGRRAPAPTAVASIAATTRARTRGAPAVTAAPPGRAGGAPAGRSWLASQARHDVAAPCCQARAQTRTRAGGAQALRRRATGSGSGPTGWPPSSSGCARRRAGERTGPHRPVVPLRRHLRPLRLDPPAGHPLRDARRHDPRRERRRAPAPVRLPRHA